MFDWPVESDGFPKYSETATSQVNVLLTFVAYKRVITNHRHPTFLTCLNLRFVILHFQKTRSNRFSQADFCEYMKANLILQIWRKPRTP